MLSFISFVDQALNLFHPSPSRLRVLCYHIEFWYLFLKQPASKHFSLLLPMLWPIFLGPPDRFRQEMRLPPPLLHHHLILPHQCGWVISAFFLFLSTMVDQSSSLETLALPSLLPFPLPHGDCLVFFSRLFVFPKLSVPPIVAPPPTSFKESKTSIKF